MQNVYRSVNQDVQRLEAGDDGVVGAWIRSAKAELYSPREYKI